MEGAKEGEAVRNPIVRTHTLAWLTETESGCLSSTTVILLTITLLLSFSPHAEQPTTRSNYATEI